MRKRTKGPRKAKFKLEYLREIDRNLMLHATQPTETVFNRFSAPLGVLRRIVYILERLLRDYKGALAIQLRASKKGEPGTVGNLMAVWQELARSLGGRTRKRRRA